MAVIVRASIRITLNTDVEMSVPLTPMDTSGVAMRLIQDYFMNRNIESQPEHNLVNLLNVES